MNVDDLVKEVDPAHAARPSGAWEQRWDRQMEEIDRDRRRRHAHRRVALAAVLPPLVLAVAVLAAVVPPWSDGSPTAAAVLDAAAASAASQAPVTLAPGQYLYSVSHSLQQVTVYEPAAGTTSGTMRLVAEATYTQTGQWWVDRTGSGRYVLTRGPLQFSSPADQAAWNEPSVVQARGGVMTRLQAVTSGTDVQTSMTDVSTLPTDPQALGSLIADGDTGTSVDDIPSGPGSTFQRAARLLVGPEIGMTPALESALYQVLAAQPGATVATGVTGQSGAQGTAVSISGASPHDVARIVIDPQTGAALEVDVAPPGPTYTFPDPGVPAATICRAASNCTSMGPGLATISIGPLWTARTSSGVVGSDTSTVPLGS